LYGSWAQGGGWEKEREGVIYGEGACLLTVFGCGKASNGKGEGGKGGKRKFYELRKTLLFRGDFLHHPRAGGKGEEEERGRRCNTKVFAPSGPRGDQRKRKKGEERGV